MEEHIVKVLDTAFVTHNVKRFKVEKPSGYTFIPGQATDVSINTAELKNELRPFTFTSLKDADYLEFHIKIYKGHNGITEKLLEINPGDELILHEVFGTIQYAGPGLFIAAGAGITPFISIFRDLKSKGELPNNRLLFANRTTGDIILKDEFLETLGDNFYNVVEESPELSQGKKHIDTDLIRQHLSGPGSYCYICGPDPFTEAMINYCRELGLDDTHIVYEH